VSKTTPVLTQSKLKKLLCYDPKTGIFTWKINISQNVRVGDVAGSALKGRYRRIGIGGKVYYAHRLVWLFVHGYFPEHVIDHKNRDKWDNRICNLREVSTQCNLRNVGVFNNNTSGIKGVWFHKAANKWQASIIVNGKKTHLGLHKTLTSAAKARWNAEVKHNFPNCCTTSSAFQYLNDTDNSDEG
jgi:hypothetical protein